MTIDRMAVEADLDLLTPLHVGTGDYRTDPDIHEIGDDAPAGQHGGARVQTVLRDVDGMPYLPGSTLKGVLRGAAEAVLAPAARRLLFGAPRAKQPGVPGDPGQIGHLFVFPARLVADDRAHAAGLPYAADDGANVYVQARTRIDRDLGTAERRKLFHHELVAPGVRFRFRAVLQCADDAARQAVETLLALLAAPDGVPVGAGEAEGQGRLRLDPGSLVRTRRTVDLGSGRLVETALDGDLPAPPPVPDAPVHDLRLRLVCDGLFVSGDSSWRPRREIDDGPRDPDMVPLTAAGGAPALLPSSVLGVLRARAAWLDATGGAADPDDRDRVVRDRDEVAGLSPTERLFGVAGWRGLVRVAALEPEAGAETIDVTNVAIDRFTGGALHGALFTTRAFVRPRFGLRLQLTTRGDYPAATDRALFELLLADLDRNGLMLGHGTGKGYGWFRVQGLLDGPAAGSRPSSPAVSVKRDGPEVDLPPPEEWEEILDRWDETGTAFRESHNVDLLAPYHFVRFNARIATPPVPSREVSHARPLATGVSGAIEMEWRVETPMMIGHHWDHGVPAQPFTLGRDGPPAIPGATLRGMVRSVFEIATFSRSQQVDLGLRFSYRDFNSSQYEDVLTSSKLNAGWLTKSDGQWYLEETECTLVKIDDLLAFAGARDIRRRDWIMWDVAAKQQFLAGLPTGAEVTYRAVPDAHGVDVAVLGGSGGDPGVVVVAGAATSPGANKSREAVFRRDGGDETRLPEAIVRSFEIGHSTRERDHWVPNPSLRYWRDRLEADPSTRIPVYFIGKLKDVAERANQDTWSYADPTFHMSLARAMKLQFRRGIGDLFPDTHRPGGDLDFADAVFGHVTKPETGDGETAALRGRVFFGDAVLLGADGQAPKSGETYVGTTVEVVAMSPRPSFWPYYLWLHENARGDDAPDFDHPNRGRLSLAGRKRYPVRDRVTPPRRPDPDQAAVTTRMNLIEPADPDSVLVFRGAIRFHNLDPVELGALLWAVTLGGRERSHRHILGRGKPFGYGQTAPRVLALRADPGPAGTDGTVLDKDTLIEGFEAYMSDKAASGVSNWAGSTQIRSLLALANPHAGEAVADELTYPDGPAAYQRIKAAAHNPNADPPVHLRQYWR